MCVRSAFFAAAFIAAAPAAQAVLSNDYEKATYAQAIEQIKGQPGRHILIYFGMEKACPPCMYTRSLLGGSALRAVYKPHYLVVDVDLYNPGAEDRAVIEKFGARWAPTLVFLDSRGKMVTRLPKGFKNEKEAMLVDEFVSQRLYARTDLADYIKANFNASGTARAVPETRLAKKAAPVDDRPRLRDVLAQKHERVAGEELKKLLSGKRMLKENQDWFLTMDLAQTGTIAASGKRKDGKADIRGPGKWYVTKKGKLCIEVNATGLDETWCRHVFRVGDDYYYAVKDQREKSLAYRFALETI